MTISFFNKRYLHHTCSLINIILLFLALLLLLLLSSAPAIAAEKKKNVYEDDDIYLRFVYRSAEQVAAFYEGRGFPKAAIKRIVQSCFVTVILKNRSDDIIWVDINNWVFETKDKKLARYKLSYWEKQWEAIKLKQAHRSTFSWTLFPETRDLQVDESVSGNIPLPLQTETFSLTLPFSTGENKKGKMKTIKVNDMTCKDAEQK